jgi:trans-aconitate methyltransferase
VEASQEPRLYNDLVWVWPFLSPPEEYEDEVAAYLRLWRERGVGDGAAVLHLGSGGGSIDWHLKSLYRVTGVDRSAAMLNYARGVNPEVEYVQGDMRTVRLGRLFDGVLLHDAIAYLTTPEEVRAAGETAAAHLRRGGVLVCLPEQLSDRFQQHEVEVDTRSAGQRSVTSVMVDFDPDPTDRTFETTFVFLIRDRGKLTVEVDTHVIGFHDPPELVEALRAAGFVPEVAAFGGDDPELRDYPQIVAVRQ